MWTAWTSTNSNPQLSQNHWSESLHLQSASPMSATVHGILRQGHSCDYPSLQGRGAKCDDHNGHYDQGHLEIHPSVLPWCQARWRRTFWKDCHCKCGIQSIVHRAWRLHRRCVCEHEEIVEWKNRLAEGKLKEHYFIYNAKWQLISHMISKHHIYKVFMC